MVYKIRNTSFFWTKSGYKNNYFIQTMSAPKRVDVDTTFAFKNKFNHHSFLRCKPSPFYSSRADLQEPLPPHQAVLLRGQGPRAAVRDHPEELLPHPQDCRDPRRPHQIQPLKEVRRPGRQRIRARLLQPAPLPAHGLRPQQLEGPEGHRGRCCPSERPADPGGPGQGIH